MDLNQCRSTGNAGAYILRRPYAVNGNERRGAEIVGKRSDPAEGRGDQHDAINTAPTRLDYGRGNWRSVYPAPYFQQQRLMLVCHRNAFFMRLLYVSN